MSTLGMLACCCCCCCCFGAAVHAHRVRGRSRAVPGARGRLRAPGRDGAPALPQPALRVLGGARVGREGRGVRALHLPLGGDLRASAAGRSPRGCARAALGRGGEPRQRGRSESCRVAADGGQGRQRDAHVLGGALQRHAVRLRRGRGQDGGQRGARVRHDGAADVAGARLRHACGLGLRQHAGLRAGLRDHLPQQPRPALRLLRRGGRHRPAPRARRVRRGAGAARRRRRCGRGRGRGRGRGAGPDHGVLRLRHRPRRPGAGRRLRPVRHRRDAGRVQARGGAQDAAGHVHRGGRGGAAGDPQRPRLRPRPHRGGEGAAARGGGAHGAGLRARAPAAAAAAAAAGAGGGGRGGRQQQQQQQQQQRHAQPPPASGGGRGARPALVGEAVHDGRPVGQAVCDGGPGRGERLGADRRAHGVHRDQGGPAHRVGQVRHALLVQGRGEPRERALRRVRGGQPAAAVLLPPQGPGARLLCGQRVRARAHRAAGRPVVGRGLHGPGARVPHPDQHVRARPPARQGRALQHLPRVRRAVRADRRGDDDLPGAGGPGGSLHGEGQERVQEEVRGRLHQVALPDGGAHPHGAQPRRVPGQLHRHRGHHLRGLQRGDRHPGGLRQDQLGAPLQRGPRPPEQELAAGDQARDGGLRVRAGEGELRLPLLPLRRPQAPLVRQGRRRLRTPRAHAQEAGQRRLGSPRLAAPRRPACLPGGRAAEARVAVAVATVAVATAVAVAVAGVALVAVVVVARAWELAVHVPPWAGGVARVTMTLKMMMTHAARGWERRNS
eukprot:scaffold561_cov306-Prasinococcus_capsulatus_cf.AAC.7